MKGQVSKTKKVPKLRFPGFNGKWEEKKLGDVIKLYDNLRIPLSSEQRALRRGIYPYYGASGIIDYVDDYLFEGEYILLGEDGANIIDRSSRLVFLAKGKFWVNNHAHIFQSIDSNIFLAEYLESLKYDKYNTGTAQPKLNSDVLKKIKVYLPAKVEQQKIASFLQTVDEYIQNLKKQKESLEEYKKGIMQKIFSQEIRFTADDGKDFPEWEEKRLGEITRLISRRNKELINAKVFSVTNKAGFVLQTEHFDKVVAGDDLRNYKIIKRGEFAYNPARINVGSIAHFNHDEVGIISSLYVCFSTVKEVNNKFFNYYLQISKTKNDFKVYGEGGVRIYLWYPLFSKIKFNLPTLPEQQKIANFLTSIDNLIELKENQFNKAQEWKKGLLQQMFV